MCSRQSIRPGSLRLELSLCVRFLFSKTTSAVAVTVFVHEPKVAPSAHRTARMKRSILVHSTIMLLLTVGCAVPRRELVPMRPTTTEMNVYRSEVVHVSILAPPQQVVGFLADVNNWKTWAPWVRAVARTSPRDCCESSSR